MDIDSKEKIKLFEGRGLGNQRSTQTRGRNSSTHLSKEQRLIKNICCEVVHCSSQATEKIMLSAGKYGTIDLFVCDKCIEIFKEKSKNDR